MSPSPAVLSARALLARADTLDELRRRLLVVAPRFHDEVRRRTLNGPRPELGVRVLTRDAKFRGITALGGRENLVLLRRSGGTPVRRYTLAHELAHTLLVDVDRDAVGLTIAEEEVLCERFAGRALMPPHLLARYLRTHGLPSDVDALRAFCRRFLVSYKAAIGGLSEHVQPGTSTAILAASLRGHPRRPGEMALRVDTSATDPRLLAPRHRRLRSAGLCRLTRWAEKAEPGDQAIDEERLVVLRSRGSGPSTWCGPVRWSAIVVNAPGSSMDTGFAPGVLAFLDVSDLKPRADDPSRPRKPARRSPPAMPPGQLLLPA